MKPSGITNIIEHLDGMNDMRSAKRTYFVYESRLWRAIQEHVTSNRCVLIDKEPHPITSSSAHGYEVNWRDASTSGYIDYSKTPPQRTDFFELEFEIEYHDRDENREYSKVYRIRLPKTLETDFTQEKFKNYVWQVRVAKEKEREEKATEQLESLIKQYPRIAKRLVRAYIAANKK